MSNLSFLLIANLPNRDETGCPFLSSRELYLHATGITSLFRYQHPLQNIAMAAFLRRITGSSNNEISPSIHDDDVVYQLHMLDDTKTLRNIVVAWTLRFDDVLHVEKLHDSLSRLLEIDDWRMLGGRLRLKVASNPLDPYSNMTD